MTIALPKTVVRAWPVFKIYVKEGKKWMPIDTMGNDPFKMQYTLFGQPQVGLYVKSIARRALPSFGTAELWTPLGNINGQNTNFKDGEITAHELEGKEIYITASLNDETPRVVFWGVCDFQKDTVSPGANAYITGKRVYKCVDLLYYHTWRATLNRHGFEYNGVLANRSPGMPWYNGRRGRDDLKQGNKSTTTPTDKWEDIEKANGGGQKQVNRFTYDGLGQLWNDKEVVEHAIHNGQRSGHLVEFTVNDVAGVLSQRENVWRVSENERAWNLIGRVLRFQRGCGVAFFDWTESGGVPTVPAITINPIHKADVEFTPPTLGTPITINGSDTSGTSVTVDLTGDQRNNETFFAIGGTQDYRYDRIEVAGEKIQVLCQLAYGDGTLARLWTADEQTTFDGLSDADPNQYGHVYRYFGIPRDWDGINGDGNSDGGSPSGGETDSIWFYCNDNGELKHAQQLGQYDGFVNPALLRILPDIPLHNGIDPTTGERYAGAGSATGPTMRGSLLVHKRTGDDAFTKLTPTTQPRLKLDGIWIGSNKTTDIATDRELKTDYDKVVVTCALELPYRAFMARGQSESAAERTKRFHLPGTHLWIGAKGAMYKIPSGGAAPTRFGDTTLLRDDRDRLAYVAALAQQWYLTAHQSAQWSLYDFAIGGSFELAGDDGEPGGGSVDYPEIGELITTMTAAGGEHTLNAPVTSVVYDNSDGKTSWICDWGELEL